MLTFRTDSFDVLAYLISNWNLFFGSNIFLVFLPSIISGTIAHQLIQLYEVDWLGAYWRFLDRWNFTTLIFDWLECCRLLTMMLEGAFSGAWVRVRITELLYYGAQIGTPRRFSVFWLPLTKYWTYAH